MIGRLDEQCAIRLAVPFVRFFHDSMKDPQWILNAGRI
jgi:hypothetical protein